MVAAPGGDAPVSADRIAVVDLSPLFATCPTAAEATAYFAALRDADDQTVRDLAARLRLACETTGCFYLAGVQTLLPEASLASVYAAVQAFFSLPVEKKLLSKASRNLLGRGYFPFETENVHAFMGRPGFPNDPVEKFGVGPVDPCPDPEYLLAHPAAAEWWEPNIWPEEPADFRGTVSDYYRTMTRVADIVMALFSVALDMDPDFVRRHFELGAHSLKINYFPPLSTPRECQTRLAEHTDAAPFTLLTMDGTKDSLKVRTRDNWTFVNSIPGTIFVNIGDTMARWTNDRWVATSHQVVLPEGTSSDRISMAFFAVPTYDTKLTCIPSCLTEGEEPHYPPMTLQEYVMHKLRSMTHGLLPSTSM